MSEWEIQMLKSEELVSFVKKTRRFHTELVSIETVGRLESPVKRVSYSKNEY